METRGQDKETGWAWPNENNGVDTSMRKINLPVTAQTSSEEAGSLQLLAGSLGIVPEVVQRCAALQVSQGIQRHAQSIWLLELNVVGPAVGSAGCSHYKAMGQCYRPSALYTLIICKKLHHDAKNYVYILYFLYGVMCHT